jgi:hypothetical protein
MELTDGKRDIVDPEVRAYVSSLVTAVSTINIRSFTLEILTRLSSVEVVRTKMDDTYLEMML